MTPVAQYVGNMNFQVQDEAMLSQVEAGDKVKFVVERPGSAMVVTQLQTNNERKCSEVSGSQNWHSPPEILLNQ
jgi:hypothetical protein